MAKLNVLLFIDVSILLYVICSGHSLLDLILYIATEEGTFEAKTSCFIKQV